MTRATRFASYASAATLCYFLAWFSIIPVPFITEETKDQIIPLVRTPPNHDEPLDLFMTSCCIGIHCSFLGGGWYHSGLIRWHPLGGGYGRSGIVRMRIEN